MKIILQESTPGEFGVTSQEDLVRKAQSGVMAALENETGLLQEDLLAKAFPRGGEMEVVDELADRMTDLYQKRMDRLSKALADATTKILEEGLTP